MQEINDFLIQHIFAVVVLGWWLIIRKIHKVAPNVTNAAKEAASKKAISLLLRLFK